MKLFLFFINSIYWLWLFIIPLVITGIPAWILYARSGKYLPLSILLLITGIISGIWLAERVRRRTGLSAFFGSISATPDIEDKATGK